MIEIIVYYNSLIWYIHMYTDDYVYVWGTFYLYCMFESVIIHPAPHTMTGSPRNDRIIS